MYTREYKEWSNWLGSRFTEDNSYNVVIDLKPQHTESMPVTARRFRNKINQAVFGNATRRFGKELAITIHAHTQPYKHFHCLVEIPERMNTPFLRLKFRSKIDQICIKDGFMKKLNYLQITEKSISSQFYNGKGNIDTALVF